MLSFKPPDVFNFGKPTEWTSWKRFLRYRQASQLYTKPGADQVSALIYAMGEKAEDIFQTFTFLAATENRPNPENEFDLVLEKFTNHFTPQGIRNRLRERARFNTREQTPNESVEEYIQALYEIVQYCEFTDKEDRIRDKMVVGLRDPELSRKLQMETTDTSTLADAINTARRYEQIKSQVKTQREVKVDAMRQTPPIQGRGRGGGRHYQHGRSLHKPGEKCGRCGRSHGASQRPAKNQKCRKCHKVGHFQVVCRTAGVREVTQGETEGKTLLLGSVGVQGEPPWKVKLTIADKETDFKIDTGADVSVISEERYKELKPKPSLKSTTVKLQSPGGPVQCIGHFVAKTQVRGNNYPFRVFVLKNCHDCLLSRDAAARMGFVERRVDKVGQEEKNAFSDIGEPAKCDPIKIILREDAAPYSISIPRCIPIPLQP